MNNNLNSGVSSKHFMVYYQQYKEGQYWSEKNHGYYYSNNISNQVWLHEGVPCKGECVTLEEAIARLPKNRTKQTRDCIMRFETTEFPVQAKTGYEKWDGGVLLDLDLDKTPLLNVSKEINDNIYEQLRFCLMDVAPNNFKYMEHSSSGVGIHIIFYFDVERTAENHRKVAEYSRTILFENIDKYIKDFSKLLNMDKVFDSIYTRPYQKCFITGIDAIFNSECNGNFDISKATYEVKQKSTDDFNYDITDVVIKRERKSMEVGYHGRLYAATALKRITKDKTEWEKLWWQICEIHYHSKQDTKWLFNEFNYDKLDETTAHVDVLKKYGIDFKKATIYHRLNEDQYLSDILLQIFNETTNGVNILVSGTGTGKNHTWIEYNRKIINDPIEYGKHKPILIVEPFNSIIDSKFDKSEVEVITGSKKFPVVLDTYKMFITNFNKILSKREGDWVVKEDAKDFLSNFELIIVDESQITVKDSYRVDVLIPFIESINKIETNTKVILQTATPMGEELIFDIKAKIIVTKRPKANTKYIFRRFRSEVDGKHKKFHIQDINCLVKYYITNNRKVFIYWRNASLQQLQSFKTTYFEPNKVAIFHKRNTGEESMEYILNEQKLGEKYDVLLSSVYFGVGNDLNDYCDAAVIIIGNNTWGEDIQAIGRWRNSTDIEACTILLDNDYDFIKYSDEMESSWDIVLNHQIMGLERLWYDKLNRDKSLIIQGKCYQIKKYEDIRILAIMKATEFYNSMYHVKLNNLKNEYYRIDVRESYDKFLECNDDYNDKLKEYNNGVKNIRNKQKKEIIEGKFNWEEINRDTKIERFAKLWKKCIRYDIDKIISAEFISKSSNVEVLELFIRFYRAIINGTVDFAELYSLLWFKYNYKPNQTFKLLNKEIDSEVYYATLSYIIFIRNKNKTDKDFILKSNYFGTLKRYCMMFKEIPNELIEMIYNKNEYSSSLEFMELQGWKDDNFEKQLDCLIRSIEDIQNMIVSMNRTQQEICKIIKFCIEYNHKSNSCSESGKISSPKKKCTVTDLFKRPEKYNLTIGQEFESCDNLSSHTGKSNTTISEWRKKGWIE